MSQKLNLILVVYQSQVTRNVITSLKDLSKVCRKMMNIRLKCWELQDIIRYLKKKDAKNSTSNIEVKYYSIVMYKVKPPTIVKLATYAYPYPLNIITSNNIMTMQHFKFLLSLFLYILISYCNFSFPPTTPNFCVPRKEPKLQTLKNIQHVF